MAQASLMMKQIDEDIDAQLFDVLASALPTTQAYMRSSVQDKHRVGEKFSALCLALEAEADFLRQNKNRHSKIYFLEDTNRHTALVPLDTEIMRASSEAKQLGILSKLNATQTPKSNTDRREYRSRSPLRIGYLNSDTTSQHSFPPQNAPNVCEEMFKRSICRDYECRLYHGVSMWDPSVRMCKHTALLRWCPHLWSLRGCMFHHGKQDNVGYEAR